ncbi:MAG: imidazolonepropionase [Planctomycetota bacterium]
MSDSVECLIEHCTRLLFPGPPGGEGEAEGEAALEHGTVAIADGRIVDVGPAGELEGRYRAAERHHGRGCLLTPGFIDSHTHLVFAGERSREFEMRCRGATYEEIAAAGGGIRATVRATREASEEELFSTARARLLRMLAGGSTTVEIKSGYGLDLDSEMRMLRVIRRLSEETPARVVATFLGAHEIPDDHRNDRQAYVDEVCERMIPAVAAEGLADFCDVFCEQGVFTPEESLRVLEAGRSAGLRPKIHADELAASGGSKVAAKVCATSADHLMETGPEGIAGLREAGVVPTLLPGTTFYLGRDRYAPARAFLEAGLPVALATDRNPGSCTLESMQFIVGLACLRMGMSPIEAFRGATANGARALGLDDQRGRIACGQDADLILWEVPHESRICYELSNAMPRTVWVAGKALGMTGNSG